MTRAVGYIRVSTQEQASEGHFGLEVQETAIRDYCQREGFGLVRLLSDEGVSGAKGLEERQGLATALALIEEGEAEVLVVYRLDRLARSLLLQETILARLGQVGGQVVSVTEPDVDSEDPTRTLIRQILGAVGEYERALIQARTTAGRAAKRAAGGYAGGRPRFGQKALDGALLPDEDEQRVIDLARQWRAEGRTYRQIRAFLEEQEGRRFGLATIGNMLREPVSSTEPG